jgi:hypothetical protein
MPVYYYTLEEDECSNSYLDSTTNDEYVQANGTAVLNPLFKWNETKYVHVNEAAAKKYEELYDNVLSDFGILLEMFNF